VDTLIAQIADHCRNHLDLNVDRLDAEGYYVSLPLCVIDTVYSIGARYQSTELTVKRYCQFFGLERLSETRFPDPARQHSISQLLEIFDRYGVERMASEVFQNRQRTSTRNGILKAEAVGRVSQLLHRFQVEFLQDAERVLGDRDFEAQFQAIPGQASGISLRYFYMLVGSEDFIKPDRMVARFIWAATQRQVTVEQMHVVIVGAAKILSQQYPSLTPRRLDHMIWNFQRSQPIEQIEARRLRGDLNWEGSLDEERAARSFDEPNEG